MKNEKTMKRLYYKKIVHDDEKRVFVWHNSYICPHCGKGLIALSNQEIERRKIQSNKQRQIFDYYDDWAFDRPTGIELEDFTCPKCGYTFAMKPGYVYENEAKSKYDIYNVQWRQNTKKLSESLHYDQKDNKFHVFVSYVDYIPTKNGLITKTRYMKWIIDLKNHRTFFYDPSMKQVLNGTNHFGQSYVLYGGMISDVSTTLWAKLFKCVCNMKGLPHRELTKRINFASKNYGAIDECNVSKYMFYLTNALNRIPNTIISYDAYKQKCECIFDPLEFFACDYYTNDFIKNSPHEIMDRQTYLKKMVKEYDLPSSKAFWKFYLDSPTALCNVMFFKSCGFKNKDVLLKLSKGKVLEKVVSTYDGNQSNDHAVKTFNSILKKMLKVSSETNVTNKVIGINDRHMIRDLIKMYNRIKASKKEYLKMMNWSGSFREIHDELSKLLSKIAYENVDIPYTEKDGQLQAEFFGYSFDLAKDTNQLVEIGQKMGICVGGYREQVLRKISKIVHVRYDDKYVGCIELGQGNSLKQAKAKYNNMMTGDLAKALKMWVKKRNIKDAEQCHDYRNLDIETHKTYDYHSLELDKDGNVVRPEVRNYTANERELEMLDEDWMPF